MKTKNLTVKKALMLDALKEALLVISYGGRPCLASVVDAIAMFDQPWLDKNYFKGVK